MSCTGGHAFGASHCWPVTVVVVWMPPGWSSPERRSDVTAASATSRLCTRSGAHNVAPAQALRVPEHCLDRVGARVGGLRVHLRRGRVAEQLVEVRQVALDAVQDHVQLHGHDVRSVDRGELRAVAEPAAREVPAALGRRDDLVEKILLELVAVHVRRVAERALSVAEVLAVGLWSQLAHGRYVPVQCVLPLAAPVEGSAVRLHLHDVARRSLLHPVLVLLLEDRQRHTQVAKVHCPIPALRLAGLRHDADHVGQQRRLRAREVVDAAAVRHEAVLRHVLEQVVHDAARSVLHVAHEQALHDPVRVPVVALAEAAAGHDAHVLRAWQLRQRRRVQERAHDVLLRHAAEHLPELVQPESPVAERRARDRGDRGRQRALLVVDRLDSDHVGARLVKVLVEEDLELRCALGLGHRPPLGADLRQERAVRLRDRGGAARVLEWHVHEVLAVVKDPVQLHVVEQRTAGVHIHQRRVRRRSHEELFGHGGGREEREDLHGRRGRVTGDGDSVYASGRTGGGLLAAAQKQE
ncbi:hypothetical protein PybrP1_001905 [[Pythium] brassicae (nom. inval.)]|nr:hypothetical protein PybrP1_001905 [[Pythium] brassicae (nom. inval.)]